jgi:hypothetical protein
MPADARFGQQATDPEAVIVAPCWSCETPQTKSVPWRHRDHQHFTWSCDDCAVDWVGPGRLAS